MGQMHLLFNHTLTEAQKQDARVRFGVDAFVALPEALQMLWSNIPPELESLNEHLAPVEAYVRKEVSEGDVVLVQGDFGATCRMVGLVGSLGATAVYATTKRQIQEVREGDKITKRSVFEHVRFRKFHLKESKWLNG
jgi:hypothetical protein